MAQRPVDPRVTLHQLELFCRVVELASVTRVAEEHRVAQPAVSAQLGSLQRRLGAGKLLYWDGRKMRPTGAGELVLVWARGVLEETEQLARALSGIRSGATGTVAVGASLTLGNYVLPRVLLSVREQLPDLHVVLRVFDPVTTVADLEDGRLDLAVVALDVPPRSARITWRPVGFDRLVLVGAPGRFAGGPDTERTVGALPFVCAAAGQTTRRLVDAQLAEAGLPPRDVVMECGTPETITQAVRAGIGVAFLSSHVVADEVATGRLTEVATPGLALRLPVLVGQNFHQPLSPAQRTVLARVVAAVRADPMPGGQACPPRAADSA